MKNCELVTLGSVEVTVVVRLPVVIVVPLLVLEVELEVGGVTVSKSGGTIAEAVWVEVAVVV